MARKRRESKAVTNAETRVAGFKALDPALNLGEGLTLASLEADIAAANTQLTDYNMHLANADVVSAAFKKTEAALNKKVKKMITAVAVRYDKTSGEFAQVGGPFYHGVSKKKAATPAAPAK